MNANLYIAKTLLESKIKNLKDGVKHINLRIQDLEQELNNSNAPKRLWKPEIGDNIVTVDAFGDPMGWELNNGNKIISNAKIKNYSAFKTRAVAKKAAKAMRIHNAIISACLQVDPDFDPDWNDRTQCKYYPIYNKQDMRWGYSASVTVKTLPICVSNRDSIEKVIEILNNELPTGE